MNANQIITALTWAEVDSKLARDCRRILMQERFALETAVKSGDAREIKSAMQEAQRVAGMWGVELN